MMSPQRKRLGAALNSGPNVMQPKRQPPPPPSGIGEGPNESAKFGEVAKKQNFGCSTN